MRTSVFVALALAFAGCTCNKSKTDGTSIDAATANGPFPTSTPTGPAIFSSPIAAAHVGKGAVYFVGLVAARGVYELTRVEPNGTAAWSIDAMSDVKWSSDAEVKVFASPGGGAFVLGRGMRSGKLVRELVNVDGTGKIVGAAEPMKSDGCSTLDGFAYLRENGDKSIAATHDFTGAPPRDLFKLKVDGDHELLCGDHAVFALTHDDALTLERAGAAPTVLLGEHDDSDDVEEFTVGDDVGVINVKQGTVSLREIGAQKNAPWKKIAVLPEGAEVGLVDADANDIFVIFTQEAHDATCPNGSQAARLSTLHVPRSGGDAHTHSLGMLACDSDDGPFFTGFSHKNGTSRFYVGWPERRPPESGQPPIANLAYVTFQNDQPSDVRRIAVEADALTDAGCDDDGCYAAALERVPGTDGMVPGPIRILKFN
ncbi:MAG TPA: hypothetical protein VF407_13580 [Polyangiaceae bacterium]